MKLDTTDKYKRYTIVDGKLEWIIVSGNGEIIDIYPSRGELKGLQTEKYKINRKKLYTDEDLLNYIKQFFEKTGRAPTMKDFDNDSGYPCGSIYYSHFGSWKNAINITGLVGKCRHTGEKISGSEKKYRSERIIDGGTKWVIVDENGGIINKYPNKEELKNLPTERFDNRVGNSTNTKYTDEELLNYLKIFHVENGRVPKKEDFTNNPEYPCCSTYNSRFGNWNNALKLVGMDIDKRKEKYTDDELLNFLKIFYEKHRKIPSQNDFLHNPEYPNYQNYQKHFGSWNNGLKLVGMDMDTVVEQGDLSNNIYKGRYWEILIRKMFGNRSIDLSGKNCLSTYDGVCPNGQTYDAKSAGLSIGGYWKFATKNKDKDDDKEAIQWYYFGAFDKDYIELLYVWRVPGEMVERDNFYVGMYGGKFNVGNMIEYDITDKIKEFL